jgi:acetyl-CoA C-acetyltransferase
MVSTSAVWLSLRYMGWNRRRHPQGVECAGLTLFGITLFLTHETFAVEAPWSSQTFGDGPCSTYRQWRGHKLFGLAGVRSPNAIHVPQQHDNKFGVASMCVGGGMGMAVIFERL